MAPRYFFEKRNKGWDRIRSGFKTRRPIAIFLDYDGTLVPIRRRPSQAVLSSRMRSLLRNLARRHGIFLSIVTGRSLPDIKKKIGLRNVFYIANHGFQIALPGRNWIHPDAKRLIPVLIEIRAKLKYAFRPVHGVFVENKILTLTVHYRNLSGISVRTVKEIVEGIVQPYRGICRITSGKRVLEIRPRVPWDKGHAVLKMPALVNCGRKPLNVYMGDDRTDEDAFKRLPRSQAITVRVGKNSASQAKYYVKNTCEVRKLLDLMERHLKEMESANG